MSLKDEIRESLEDDIREALNLKPQPQDYTSSMESAWKVIDAMRTQGFTVTLRQALAGDITKTIVVWRCHFSHWFWSEQWIEVAHEEASSDSGPLAVCEAALIALGE